MEYSFKTVDFIQFGSEKQSLLGCLQYINQDGNQVVRGTFLY